jgi:hypothetical protein
MRYQPTRTYSPELKTLAAEHPVPTAAARYQVARLELAKYFSQQAVGAQPDPGAWIHLGCGGELVRLQGIPRPVCTECGKEAR